MRFRGGKPLVYGDPFITGGSTAVFSFDLASFGTFTRSTEASYQTSASSIAWAAANTIRIEDRGDGSGGMILLEGSSKNWLTYSETFGTTWAGGGTRTGGAVLGPDGTTYVDRLNMASGDAGWYQYYSSYTGPSTHTSWVRAVSGTAFARRCNVTYGLVQLSGCVVEATVGTSWQRVGFTYSEASGGTYAMVADARSWSTYGGTGASASDCYWASSQVERMPFCTSAIRTTSATVTRGADILSGSMSSVPSKITSDAYSIDVAPIFSSADGIAYAKDQCIFSFAEDDSERLFFVVSGGSIYLRVVSGGSTKVTSGALSFSANQKLTIAVNSASGSVTVSGATSGNGTSTGTPWGRTLGPTFYVGNRQGATQPSYVRIGRYVSAS